MKTIVIVNDKIKPIYCNKPIYNILSQVSVHQEDISDGVTSTKTWDGYIMSICAKVWTGDYYQSGIDYHYLICKDMMKGTGIWVKEKHISVNEKCDELLEGK